MLNKTLMEYTYSFYIFFHIIEERLFKDHLSQRAVNLHPTIVLTIRE